MSPITLKRVTREDRCAGWMSGVHDGRGMAGVHDAGQLGALKCQGEGRVGGDVTHTISKDVNKEVYITVCGCALRWMCMVYD